MGEQPEPSIISDLDEVAEDVKANYNKVLRTYAKTCLIISKPKIVSFANRCNTRILIWDQVEHGVLLRHCSLNSR